MTQYVLLTALLPIAVLAFYIYNKDKEKPEPTGLLMKAFFFGVLSVFVSLCISIPLGELGFYPSEPTTIIGSISRAFFAAAIPEEIAKFLMLLLVLRNNTYFDEKMDGIVYAVCVSLGFAAFENVMYLFSNMDDFLSVGLTRALFAVPGHFCDGVLMGYYYSKVRFCSSATTKDQIMVLAAPIILHGLYDAILFVIPVAPYISGLLVIVFLVFCHKMWKYASARIQEYVGK